MEIQTKLITAPALEPVTLAEMEMHLRISSNDIESDLQSTQSIAAADHAVAAAYSLEGTGVDVLNTGTVVYLHSGTNNAGATVDAKIQESDDDITYTDVSGGAFVQVTTANDNATQEKAYTGIKQYIRVVATVAVDSCAFCATIVTQSPLSVEDDYINSLITTSRQIIENITNKRFITQTWAKYMDSFPSGTDITPLYYPLQSVTTVNYYDTDSTEATFAASNYNVGTSREPGLIRLGYSKQWPTTTLRTLDGVIVTYVTGYGDARSDVPERFKQAIKILGAELYEHREATDYQSFKELPWSVQSILWLDRRVPV